MSHSRKRPADTQEADWVAGEDRFVLEQAKKKAAIRVKEGRAKPIDWLAVTLRFIDPSRNPFDDEVTDADLEIVDPEGVFEGLDSVQLAELEKDIDVYAALETNKTNVDFWNTMDIICKDRHRKTQQAGPRGLVQQSVTAEVEKMFAPKTYEQLHALEKQIKTKLRSNEPIDVEYWENLLHNLQSWKARAKLRQVSHSIVKTQLSGLRVQQEEDANHIRKKLSTVLNVPDSSIGASHLGSGNGEDLDPEPLLKAREEDRGLQLQDESEFSSEVASERRKIMKLGFVPVKRKADEGAMGKPAVPTTTLIRSNTTQNDEFSQATTALYEREVARGVGEDEEIFASEEEVAIGVKPLWANKHRPRKPRYFNRVQMGYEWNKYNQTHYDHENPPPKVVQGYKFNIFYPELIDKTKAPTYKIERENGRKRGQSFAPAGEEDTCLIRFIAGPPYEDVAFRIVDKEWDYSAKRERGFKSSFDKGILQLHFQFKKIFYRK